MGPHSHAKKGSKRYQHRWLPLKVRSNCHCAVDGRAAYRVSALLRSTIADGTCSKHCESRSDERGHARAARQHQHVVLTRVPFSEQYCLKACSNSFCVSGGGVSSASLFLGLLRRRFCAESSPGVLRAMAPARCRPQQTGERRAAWDCTRIHVKRPLRGRCCLPSNGINVGARRAAAARRGLAGRRGVWPGGTLRTVRPSAAAVGISVRPSPPSLWPSPGLGSTIVLWRARGAETAGWRVFCTTKAFSMTGASMLALREPESRSLSEAGRVEGRAEWGLDGGQTPGSGTVRAQSCGDALGSGCAAPGCTQSAKVTLSGSAPPLS